MKAIKQMSLALVLAASAPIASATNFYLCPDVSSPNCTDVFEQMNIFADSTSVYTDVDGSGSISAGDTVVDLGAGNVTGFQPFVFGTTETQNYQTDWVLNLDYTDITAVVTGVVDDPAIDPQTTGNGDGEGQIGEEVQVAAAFTGGTFNVYYQDNAAFGAQVLVAQFNVLSGSGGIANVVLDMEVDFTNTEDLALSQSLFFLEDGRSWWDVWNENDPVAIAARLDTNIDPVEVTACSPEFNGDLCRNTELDGSVRISVPEPSSLALLGAGLIGFGMSRKKAKA